TCATRAIPRATSRAWSATARSLSTRAGRRCPPFQVEARHDAPGALLARARRRPHPVRPLPALLRAPRGPARLLLRPRAREGPDRPHHLRPLERVLRRSDREEAAQPFPARHVGAE